MNNYSQPADLVIDYQTEIHKSFNSDRSYSPQRKTEGTINFMKLIEEARDWARDREIQAALDKQKEHAATLKNPARNAIATESILF